jgi:lipoprotein-anchoring transpeptidase ErfK/SrfK
MVKRTIIFALIVVGWAFIAAVAARSATRDVVAFTGFAPGTIVVKTNERQLYYVIEPGRAMRFPVGVGRAGKIWTGKAVIEGKYVAPAWSPPDDIKREHPDLPEVIPGGAEDNPMGAAALTMHGGDYAIHGTNSPASIGSFVSYGCIRMFNRDIRTLYRLVDVGTLVIVEQ